MQAVGDLTRPQTGVAIQARKCGSAAGPSPTSWSGVTSEKARASFRTF